VKKILIGLGLAALLSSCLDTGLISVVSGDVDFKSNYIRTSGGVTEQVICRNKNDTLLTLSFTFNGRASDFKSFQVRIFGKETSASNYDSPVFEVFPTPSAGVDVVGNRITVQFGFPANTSPYAAPVNPQAVIVVPAPNPIPVNTVKIGAADLRLRITDVSGNSAASSFLVQEIPVFNPCS
jgi:hypothetical protein